MLFYELLKHIMLYILHLLLRICLRILPMYVQIILSTAHTIDLIYLAILKTGRY